MNNTSLHWLLVICVFAGVDIQCLIALGATPIQELSEPVQPVLNSMSSPPIKLTPLPPLEENGGEANRPAIRPVESSPAADGTWSQVGDTIIIELNGEKFRLTKTEKTPTTDAHSADRIRSESLPDEGKETVGAEVVGRLSQAGRPLVDCEVSLVSLTKKWSGFRVDDDLEPLLVRTNARGEYYFQNVANGMYKMRWRPRGQTYWIRKLEMRPDVRVRGTDSVHVKEIRTSLRTIN